MKLIVDLQFVTPRVLFGILLYLVRVIHKSSEKDFRGKKIVCKPNVTSGYLNVLRRRIKLRTVESLKVLFKGFDKYE